MVMLTVVMVIMVVMVVMVMVPRVMVMVIVEWHFVLSQIKLAWRLEGGASH